MLYNVFNEPILTILSITPIVTIETNLHQQELLIISHKKSYQVLKPDSFFL
jgi:hypothetical protein